MISSLRAGFRFTLPVLVLLLLGCGPGVEGTGTGDSVPSALQFFGAKPASVCSSPFAGELKCRSRVVIGPTFIDPTEGTELVNWVDNAANSQVVGQISGSEIVFEALCTGVRFTGTWGKRAEENVGRFYGFYSTLDSGFSSPGTLSAQAVNGAGVAYVLEDASGRTVFGPRVLMKAPGNPAPAQCHVPQTSQTPDQPVGKGSSSAAQNDAIVVARPPIQPSQAR